MSYKWSSKAECGPEFEQIPTARDYYQIAHLIPE